MSTFDKAVYMDRTEHGSDGGIRQCLVSAQHVLAVALDANWNMLPTRKVSIGPFCAFVHSRWLCHEWQHA